MTIETIVVGRRIGRSTKRYHPATPMVRESVIRQAEKHPESIIVIEYDNGEIEVF